MPQRFELDEAARHMEGLVDRTVYQKHLTDMLMRTAHGFASFLEGARRESDEAGEAGAVKGDPEAYSAAFDILDHAVKAAFHAIVPAAAPAEPAEPEKVT